MRISDWISDVCSSDLNLLTFDEGYWFVNVRHLLTVERPHEPLHVAGEMDVEAARGRPDVGISRDRHQVTIDEHLVPRIFQALAGLAGAVHRHRRNGLHARAALDLRPLAEIAHVH